MLPWTLLQDWTSLEDRRQGSKGQIGGEWTGRELEREAGKQVERIQGGRQVLDRGMKSLKEGGEGYLKVTCETCTFFLFTVLFI